MSLETFASSLFFSYFVVFARLGTALIFMPGFGETQIPVRVRLSFALVLCAALLPATPGRQILPTDPLEMGLLLGTEATIGLWIGLTARITSPSLS